MSTEDRFIIALAILCVLLLIGGTVAAGVLSRARPRVLRIVWPLVALATAGMFATFVLVARLQAH